MEFFKSDHLEMNKMIDDPSINKDEVDIVNKVILEKDRNFIKVEKIKNEILDLKLNVELFEVTILRLENKRERLVSDNISYDGELDKNLDDITRSISSLVELIKKTNKKIEEMEIGLEIRETMNRSELESLTESQIQNN